MFFFKNKIALLFGASFILLSCSKTEWHEKVLDDYVGSYKRISFGTELVEQSPETIIINKDYVKIVYPYNEDYYGDKRYIREGRVLRSNYNPSKNSSVIFFGEPDRSHIAHYRIEIKLDYRGYLSVYDIIPTGHDNGIFNDFLGVYNK